MNKSNEATFRSRAMKKRNAEKLRRAHSESEIVLAPVTAEKKGRRLRRGLRRSFSDLLLKERLRHPNRQNTIKDRSLREAKRLASKAVFANYTSSISGKASTKTRSLREAKRRALGRAFVPTEAAACKKGLRRANRQHLPARHVDREAQGVNLTGPQPPEQQFSTVLTDCQAEFLREEWTTIQTQEEQALRSPPDPEIQVRQEHDVYHEEQVTSHDLMTTSLHTINDELAGPIGIDIILDEDVHEELTTFRNDDQLVEATAIRVEENSVLPQAEMVDPEVLERRALQFSKARQCRRIGYAIIGVSTLITVLAAVFSRPNSDQVIIGGPVASETAIPSDAPSAAPSGSFESLDLSHDTWSTLR